MFLENTNKIIVEIGVNHEGNFESAKKILRMACEAGAQIIKFQSYSPERFISANDMQRLERVKKFSLSAENFLELSKITSSFGAIFLSTPVTEDWVEKLNPICPAFKIASGDITFKPVIKAAAKTGKPLIISTGAATLKEIDQAVNWVKDEVGENNLKNRLILMHCVSAYPAPLNQANILSIPFLKERYGLKVGYSNHVKSMSACLTAVALGADLVEVHFTDCKEGREFRDHELSFDQNDLRTFIKMADEIRQSLGTYGKEVQNCEKEIISAIRKGIIAARDLKKGEILSINDLSFARPATEFSSNDIEKLVGFTLKSDIDKGFLITKESI